MENLCCSDIIYNHKKFDMLRKKLREIIAEKSNMREKQNKNATSTPHLRGKKFRKISSLCLTPETDTSLSPIKAPDSNVTATAIVTESSVVGRNLKRKHVTADDDDLNMKVAVTTKKQRKSSVKEETSYTVPPTPSSATTPISARRRKTRQESSKENTHFVHITGDDDEEYNGAAINRARSNAVPSAPNTEHKVKTTRVRRSSAIPTPPSTISNSLEEDQPSCNMQFGAIKSRLRRKSENSKYDAIIHYINTMKSD
uniref:Uncharacterized protein n=1 Tax=Bactrocera latifrons TaxID=174628 RepID=A0A0K8V168_BACLA